MRQTRKRRAFLLLGSDTESTVGLAKVGNVGVHKNTSLDNTNHELDLGIKLLGARGLEGRENGVKEKVAVISDHGAGLGLTAETQSHGGSTLGSEVADHLVVGKGDNLNRNALSPLNTKLVALLAVVGNKDKLASTD